MSTNSNDADTPLNADTPLISIDDETLNITYHRINKSRNTIGSIEMNPNLVTTHPPLVVKFLNDLNTAYGKKTGKGFGVFSTDTDSYPMPNLLKEYFDNKDFQSLTVRMMNLLVTNINKKTAATGGDVFIAHYKIKQNEYILIAVITRKDTYNEKEWELVIERSFDIDDLKFAGRINITTWLNQDEGHRYISFIRGKANTSDYFRDFLSCDDAISGPKETKKLIDLLKKFAKDKKLNFDDESIFFNKAHQYLKECSDKEKEFNQEAFANSMWSEEPSALLDLLSDPESGVSDGFTPDGRSLKSLATYSGKTKDWQLSFNRDAISKGQVAYVDGKIVINNPTPEILEAFE